MSILLWTGVGLIGLLVAFFLLILSSSSRVNSPGSHNAKAINKEKSKQYYIEDGKVIYVMGANFFNIGGKEILGAEVDTFEVLDQDYAKDKHFVYYHGRTVVGADPVTATVIPNSYSHVNNRPAKRSSSGFLKDAHSVYCGWEVLNGADPESFTALWGVYGMDKEFVFYFNEFKIPRTDSPSFIANSGIEVLRMNNKIYYSGQLISHQAESFVTIDDNYSKDESHVYRNGNILEGVDAESFRLISPYFRVDKNKAYYFDMPIIGSIPTTFEIFNDTLSRDSCHVYYQECRIEDISPADINRSRANNLAKRWLWRPLYINETTVKLVPDKEVDDITSYYHSYKNEVYSSRKKEEGIRPSDVIVLDEEDKCFTRIRDDIFYYGTVIPNADPETFTPISEQFSKDMKQVYWCEHPVVDAEASLFEYTEGLYAEENEQGEYKLAKFDSALF